MNSVARFAWAVAAMALISPHLVASSASASRTQPPAKPTIVLVHGAFAESASWDSVARRLRARHYPVIAAANPLRGLRSDAAAVAAVVASVEGPVVLVGHSYGGSVISAAAEGLSNVKALVFVAAFAPEVGESAVDLSSKHPGSTLGPALAAPVVLADGGKDLYIRQDRFHDQFAADVSPGAAQLMAVSQRPIAESALAEGAPGTAWKHLPSWFVYGERDRNIPAATLAFMAERAKSKKTIAVPGASHVVMVSQPVVVTRLILDAATASVER